MDSAGLPGAGGSSAEGLAGRPRQQHFREEHCQQLLLKVGVGVWESWPSCDCQATFSLLLSFYVDDCMSYCPMQSAWQRKGFEHVGSLVRLEDPTPLQLYIACINRRFTHGSFDGRRSPGVRGAWTIYVLFSATVFAVARCE